MKNGKTAGGLKRITLASARTRESARKTAGSDRLEHRYRAITKARKDESTKHERRQKSPARSDANSSPICFRRFVLSCFRDEWLDSNRRNPIGRPVNGYEIRRQPANLGQIDTFGILWRSRVTVHRATVILSAAKDLAPRYSPGDPSLRSEMTDVLPGCERLPLSSRYLSRSDPATLQTSPN